MVLGSLFVEPTHNSMQSAHTFQRRLQPYDRLGKRRITDEVISVFMCVADEHRRYSLATFGGIRLAVPFSSFPEQRVQVGPEIKDSLCANNSLAFFAVYGTLNREHGAHFATQTGPMGL